MPKQPFRVVPWPRSPYWYVTFRFQGKRIVRSTEQAERAQAEREAAQIWLQTTARCGAPAQAPGLTLKEYADAWADSALKAKAERRGPRYAAAQVGNVVNHILTRFPRATGVTTEAWDAACQDMHDDGLTWQTIQRVTSSARALLRYIYGDDAPTLHAPPAEDARLEAAHRRAMSVPERDTFLAAVAKIDPFAHRAYTVMFYSAMRESEVEKLRRRWIVGAYVHFPAPSTKSKAPGQDLYLTPRVRKAISEQQAARGDISPDEPIFGPFDLRRVFLRALAATGIDRTGLTAHHTARHTCATLAAEGAPSIAHLQAVTRHRSLAMVERYVHPNGELSKEVLSRMSCDESVTISDPERAEKSRAGEGD
jgi:integrase